MFGHGIGLNTLLELFQRHVFCVFLHTSGPLLSTFQFRMDVIRRSHFHSYNNYSWCNILFNGRPWVNDNAKRISKYTATYIYHGKWNCQPSWDHYLEAWKKQAILIEPWTWTFPTLLKRIWEKAVHFLCVYSILAMPLSWVPDAIRSSLERVVR